MIDLAIALAHGAELRSASRSPAGDPAWRILLPPTERLGFLADAAAVDGLRPDLVRLARIVTAGLSARDAAQAIHALVRDGVRFAAEPSETFSGALITARWRVGDCDDSARLLVALARAGGLNAGIAQLPPPPAAPVHVAAVIWAAGGWRWAETTIAAEFGEHPVVAARRLGIRCRSDLAMIRFRRANG